MEGHHCIFSKHPVSENNPLGTTLATSRSSSEDMGDKEVKETDD
jgi:hypothetical protein